MTDDERQAKALELKVMGWSYYDIAKALDYPDDSEAHRAVSAALASRPLTREIVIIRQVRDLLAMLHAIAPRANAGDRRAQNTVKQLRRHMARLDLAAAREYVRRRGIALPPELERELNR